MHFFQFGTIFFTDAFCVKIILEPNNTYRVPLGISGLNTVMSYQLVGDTNTIKDVSGSLDYVNFTIDTTPDAGSKKQFLITFTCTMKLYSFFLKVPLFKSGGWAE